MNQIKSVGAKLKAYRWTAFPIGRLQFVVTVSIASPASILFSGLVGARRDCESR